MRKRYKTIKLPLEAYLNFINKKAKMENTIKEVTKKPTNIKFTNFFRFISQKPTDFVYPEELVNYFCKYKRKRQEGLII
jgi:hypothetical protein